MSRRETTSPLRQAAHARSLGANDPRLGRNARNTSTGQDYDLESIYFDGSGRVAVRPSEQDVRPLQAATLAPLEVDEVTSANGSYANAEMDAILDRTTALESRSNATLVRVQALESKVNELLAALRRDKRLKE